MSYLRDEYEKYFESEKSISLPEFQLAFNLSYNEVCKIVEAYGERLKYEKGFLYTYVGEPTKEEKATVESSDEEYNEGFDDEVFKELNNLLNEVTIKEKNEELIMGFIENMPDYSEDTHTFTTYLKMLYPNGLPLSLRFSDEEELCFTDNGTLKEYMSEFLSNNHEDIVNIDDIISDMLEDCSAVYKNGEVFLDISTADDEADLFEAISFFTKTFEEIIRKTIIEFKEKNMSIEEKMNKNTKILLKKYKDVKTENQEAFEEVAMDIIESIVSIDISITRNMAQEHTKNLIEEAKRVQCSKTCVEIFERILSEFQLASDKEFDLLKAQIFS